MICHTCGASRQSKPTATGERLPRGWKRDTQQQPICDACWHRRYVLRAVSVPIAEVVTDRAAFQSAIHAGWQAATHAANLAVQALLRAETLRAPDSERCPAAPAVYLYGELRGKTAMDPRSLVCLLSAVERKWRATRARVVWSQSASPPLYRYPAPYPVPPDQYVLRIEPEGGALLCEIRVGGMWHTLRLRGGKGMRRQWALLRQCIDGRGQAVEAALLAGGRTGALKVAAWLPRVPRSETLDGVMQLRTSEHAFVTAVVGDRDPWRINADHVRRWISEYDCRRLRLAEDMKYEKRWPKHTREAMVDAGRALAAKQRNRLKDWIGSSTRMVAEFARRQRVAEVVFDDMDRRYVASFPWAEWTSRLTDKLDEYGIGFRRECGGGDGDSGPHSPAPQMEDVT